MSGHNKWSTIKRKKGAVDAKRGKLFSKLIKEITVAARMGGGDETGNPRLRSAVLTARAANMPRDNIDRAIKRGTGEIEGVEYLEISYEGYGPAGIAVVVDVLTDNKNRTVGEVRHLFTKHGGNLAQNGAVGWKFETKGVITVSETTEETLFEAALEAGAEDIQKGEDGEFYVYCEYTETESVREALDSAGFTIEAAELQKLATTPVNIDEKDAPKVLRLIEALEDNDDVQKVWSDFEIDDAILESLSN
ncbi:MAG: YebC/PmpR family DNA-binding transcriptional regulator [Myxococcales bacterium]|nr:YebC/PmpR family DNA-binding transcriptional regulator [Myxococcales bacterium]